MRCESYRGGVCGELARFRLFISVVALGAAAAVLGALPPQSSQGRGIGIQVGAFQRPEGAARLTRELAEKGYPARTIPTASLHRVVVGPLPNQSAAEALLVELKRRGYDGYVRNDVAFVGGVRDSAVEAQSRPPANPVLFNSPGGLRLAQAPSQQPPPTQIPASPAASDASQANPLPAVTEPVQVAAAAPEPQGAGSLQAADSPLTAVANTTASEGLQSPRPESQIAATAELGPGPSDVSVQAGSATISGPLLQPSAAQQNEVAIPDSPSPAVVDSASILETSPAVAAAGEATREAAVEPAPRPNPIEHLLRDVSVQTAPAEPAATPAEPTAGILLAQKEIAAASPESPAEPTEQPSAPTEPSVTASEPLVAQGEESPVAEAEPLVAQAEPAAQAELPTAQAEPAAQTEPAASPGQAGEKPQLTIKILEGNEVVHTVGQRSARDPVVQVTDENNRPVGGAVVVFDLPARGASGTFANGARSVTVLTGPDGTASATGFTANAAQGQYAMQVTASHQGQTASTVVAQTNAAAGGGLSAAATAGIVAGIAGGAAVALVVVKNSIENRVRQEVAARNPPSVITTVSPGASSVGAP